MATRDKPGGGQSPPQLSRALDAVRGLLAPVGPLAAPAAPQVRLCARIRRWVGASEAGASAATDSLSHARSRARRLPAVAGRGSSSSGHRAPRSVPRGCAQHRNACMHGPDSRVHVRGLASQLGALDAAHTACRPPSRRAAPAKLVRVPVRPRSGRPHAAGSSGWRSVGLPATPAVRKPATEAAPPALTPAPPGAEHAQPGGGVPASTPLAAEVLASLGLGAATIVHPPAAERAWRQPAGSALAAALEAAVDPVAGRNAALAAAAAAAAAAPALRLRAAPAGNVETRQCNCKRSQCLKLYCVCFAAGEFGGAACACRKRCSPRTPLDFGPRAGGVCAPGVCSCTNCFNTASDDGAVQAARAVVLAKNPLAFQAKVRCFAQHRGCCLSVAAKLPPRPRALHRHPSCWVQVTAKAGHKKGCRCKRSKCLRRYCECFSGGARCNPDVCACEGCRNM